MLRCIRVVLQSSNSSFGFNYMGGQHIHIPLYVFHSHLNFFFESCLLFCVDTRIAIIAEARKVTGSHMLWDIFWWCTKECIHVLASLSWLCWRQIFRTLRLLRFLIRH